MEAFDIIMLVVVGGATLFGFLKGFAWQLASLASLVLSYACALKFADRLAPHLNADPRWSKYLAMLVIYAGTSLAVWMIFRAVSRGIDRVRLREFDRQMGGLLGLGKGVLMCTIITFFAVTLSEQSRGAVLRSKSGVYIAEFLHKATPIMPPELNALLGPYIDRIQRGLGPLHPAPPSPFVLPPTAGGAPPVQGGPPLQPELQQALQNLPQLLQGLQQTYPQFPQNFPPGANVPQFPAPQGQGMPSGFPAGSFGPFAPSVPR